MNIPISSSVFNVVVFVTGCSNGFKIVKCTSAPRTRDRTVFASLFVPGSEVSFTLPTFKLLAEGSCGGFRYESEQERAEKGILPTSITPNHHFHILIFMFDEFIYTFPSRIEIRDILPCNFSCNTECVIKGFFQCRECRTVSQRGIWTRSHFR